MWICQAQHNLMKTRKHPAAGDSCNRDSILWMESIVRCSCWVLIHSALSTRLACLLACPYVTVTTSSSWETFRVWTEVDCGWYELEDYKIWLISSPKPMRDWKVHECRNQELDCSKILNLATAMSGDKSETNTDGRCVHLRYPEFEGETENTLKLWNCFPPKVSLLIPRAATFPVADANAIQGRIVIVSFSYFPPCLTSREASSTCLECFET